MANNNEVKEHNEKLLSKIQTIQRMFLADDGGYNSDGAILMEDLEFFCFKNKTTYDPDPEKRANNEGRRQVLIRLENILKQDITKLIDNIKNNNSTEEADGWE